jgi:dsRNA-specific ribonuclease
MPASKTNPKLRSDAWIGDAVLALFAREWILYQADIAPAERAEAFTRLTANQFLASLGEPTAVEATIGKIYQAEGLSAAFAWIEAECIPLYLKQRHNRRKANGSHRDKSK